MSAIKSGKKYEQGTKSLFVGFTVVKPVAFNPTREEINKLLGKEDNPNDKPNEYLSTDKDGNDKIRCNFWLKDNLLNTHFIYSFNITRKDYLSKDGQKIQLVNSTCNTTWVPLGEDGEPDYMKSQQFFRKFIDNKTKEEIGDKKYRIAFAGEESLVKLVRQWLRIKWSDRDTEVSFDIEKLFREDYSEITELIKSDYATSFTALLGVRTDKDDSSKKYQAVWGEFLNKDFAEYIAKGIKFPDDYSRNTWTKFEEKLEGEYGFDCFYKLKPVSLYVEEEHPLNNEKSKVSDKTTTDY